MDHRWLTVLGSVLLFVGSIVLAATQTSFQLFPPVGVDQYIVRVTSPPGTSIENTRLALREVDQVIRAAIRPEHLEATVLGSGEAEKNEESFRDLGRSFLFALLGIFFILAIQFNNLGYPLIVMSAIPFGIVGIILTFFVHGLFKPMPLSFFSTMGMAALSGVVVNNAIVLLDFVQRAVHDGVPIHEAAVQAGRRRLRAVLLTSITTVVGLLPTGYGWGGFDPFVAPMALALGWGLAFATVITLFLLPALLVALDDTAVAMRRRWASRTGRGR